MNTSFFKPAAALFKQAVAVLLFPLLGLSMAPAYAQEFSLAINNGRVIDPETNLDAIAHLGIRDSTIVKVSETPLRGVQVIDASGLVVAPGFIDLHTHSPTQLGQYHQLFDGVTTALELEAGAFPIASYGSKVSEEALINYGASAGYLSMRLLQKNGLAATDMSGTPKPANIKGWITAIKLLLTGQRAALEETFETRASETERDNLQALLHEGLDQGGIGIGLALDYISEAVDSKELHMIFTVAAARGAPLFIHIRRGVNGDPEGLREIIALAEETGAAVHICHISHNAMKNTALFLAEIRAARARGVDITTEVLPYNAGSTLISAAVFNRDWQTIFAISYADVEWAANGERLTQQTFAQYQKDQPQGAVIHHYLKDAWTQTALREPGVIVVSDLVAMKSRDENVPPHNGAFTRVLGHYSREQNVIDMPTALKKMTLLPAQRLEIYAPAFRKKGRIQEGMDADLTIFDAATVRDRATYRNPYQEAVGIAHVVINGQQVVRSGSLVPGVFPGTRLVVSHLVDQKQH